MGDGENETAHVAYPHGQTIFHNKDGKHHSALNKNNKKQCWGTWNQIRSNPGLDIEL